jgi:hypothetical protein
VHALWVGLRSVNLKDTSFRGRNRFFLTGRSVDCDAGPQNFLTLDAGDEVGEIPLAGNVDKLDLTVFVEVCLIPLDI